MAMLIAGLVIFLGIHSLSIVNEPLRNRLSNSMGEWPFKGAYSVVSLLGLVLIVIGYGAARLEPTVLYTPPGWLRHVAMLLLIPVFPLLFATYFPGRIKATLKHPMLVAVKLWALAHLLANGMLHDVLLFGAFLAWAVVDRISMKRRTQRAIITMPKSGANDAIAVIGGLAVYFITVFWAHQWLIGVSPV
ncbi:NnrU family protein, required for expression of nitric oxide and nitrite reductases (Nir and Nor) [Marinobacter nitratireducens]|uniref:NnrU family protein, required for expression of nitric oxide and nitrite reductases (Nir and Nor) n=1 Tax=Marinobacter nitratireducens TaxID=1137280 RepID=A0A072MZY5_9GAMM|nr:NnrU family protein [Marinobacter nitratireducens]KEF30989.1 NnrU family protein, required for expression of nitric oxide and nitrite reductases (Nir and Nor) [Marinobacter nitratireducens]TNE96240.1 MAG: NnrU family protein [Gammaproteobacteria bacterium]